MPTAVEVQTNEKITSIHPHLMCHASGRCRHGTLGISQQERSVFCRIKDNIIVKADSVFSSNYRIKNHQATALKPWLLEKFSEIEAGEIKTGSIQLPEYKLPVSAFDGMNYFVIINKVGCRNVPVEFVISGKAEKFTVYIFQ